MTPLENYAAHLWALSLTMVGFGIATFIGTAMRRAFLDWRRGRDLRIKRRRLTEHRVTPMIPHIFRDQKSRDVIESINRSIKA